MCKPFFLILPCMLPVILTSTSQKQLIVFDIASYGSQSELVKLISVALINTNYISRPAAHKENEK